MELTEAVYWDEYWQSIPIPNCVNPNHSRFDSTIVQALDRYLHLGSGKTALEIGCAPGRWLVHLAEAFGYSVDGIELAPAVCRNN